MEGAHGDHCQASLNLSPSPCSGFCLWPSRLRKQPSTCRGGSGHTIITMSLIFVRAPHFGLVIYEPWGDNTRRRRRRQIATWPPVVKFVISFPCSLLLTLQKLASRASPFDVQWTSTYHPEKETSTDRRNRDKHP
jgi:hypothetical protein